VKLFKSKAEKDAEAQQASLDTERQRLRQFQLESAEILNEAINELEATRTVLTAPAALGEAEVAVMTTLTDFVVALDRNAKVINVIDIDDVSWPVDNPGTPQNERWNYVFANYFRYDNSQPGAAKWTAYFPPLPLQLPVVTWSFYHNGDKVGGILQSLIITISDKNANGIVDPTELNIQAVAGNLVAHIEQGTGVYEGFCGQGSMNGTMEGYDLSQPYVFTISTGNLLLRNFNCAVPVEERTWGAVKEMYSE